MASSIMSSVSYLNYLNNYIHITLNGSDRCLIGNLNKSYFDEIENHACKILAEWYSQQIIDEQSSLYIKNVGYLNRKIGLLTYKYCLNKIELDRIENLLFNSEIIQLLTSIIQSIIETNARHQDNFICDLSILLDAYTTIKRSKLVFNRLTKQAIESQYYKQYLIELLSSTIKPIHVFFIGIIGQLTIPILNSTFNEYPGEFLKKFYNGNFLLDNHDVESCTLGILSQMDISYLLTDYSLVSILISIFINLSLKLTTENNKNFLFLILKIFNHLCIQSKTIACYLNSDQLVEILLRYVTNQDDFRLNIYTCVVLGHIVSEKQLNELRISYKLTMKLMCLLYNYPEQTNNILQSLLSLAIHEQIQSVIGNACQLTALIELSQDYTIIYDIIWKLSFHPDILDQLITRHNDFLKKLQSLSQIAAADGILQNVQMKNLSRLPSKHIITHDIALVFSPKDRPGIEKIEDYFEKSNLRIGKIQNSSEILLCISEESKHDCTCQATIRQALFDCKKIIHCTIQTSYRFDDWFRRLNIEEKKLFHCSQASLEKMMLEIQTDLNTKHHLPAITKHARIVTPLQRNLHVNRGSNSSTPSLPPQPPVASSSSMQLSLPVLSSPRPPIKKIQNWTKQEVMEWCARNNLNNFTKILTLYDGRSLLALAHVSRMSVPNTIINQLRNDCRKYGLSLSFVEYVRFQAALDDLLHLERTLRRKQSISTIATRYVFKRKPNNIN